MSQTDDASELFDSAVLARRMREANDRVVVAMYSASDRLHAAGDGDSPRCREARQSGVNWRAKPLEVFPAGHRQWCRHCVSEETGVPLVDLPEEVRAHGK